jgi:hypothetical protein
MRKAGVHKHVIMSITGHATDVMFRRYDSIDMDDKQQAANQLETFLGADVYQDVCQGPKQGSIRGQIVQ